MSNYAPLGTPVSPLVARELAPSGKASGSRGSHVDDPIFTVVAEPGQREPPYCPAR